MRTDDEEAKHFGVIAFQDIANGEEIAKGLGHFFVIDADETVVHPVIDERMM